MKNSIPLLFLAQLRKAVIFRAKLSATLFQVGCLDLIMRPRIQHSMYLHPSQLCPSRPLTLHTRISNSPFRSMYSESTHPQSPANTTYSSPSHHLRLLRPQSHFHHFSPCPKLAGPAPRSQRQKSQRSPPRPHRRLHARHHCRMGRLRSPPTRHPTTHLRRRASNRRRSYKEETARGEIQIIYEGGGERRGLYERK